LSGLALIVGLSACGATSPHSAAAPTSSASSSTGAEPSTTSPLDAYLGAGGGTVTEMSATRDREYQEAIAQCMAAQGFDYIPQPAGAITTTREGGYETVHIDQPSFPDLPPAQFAARYGYGISTAPASASRGAIDPNEKLVTKMSVAERVAYQHALYGESTPLDSQGYLTNSVDESSQACLSRADKAVPSDKQEDALEHRVSRAQAAYQSLLDRIHALNDSELADPRVAIATQTWSQCLATAGFPGYTGTDQPRAKILSQARALMGHDLDPASADPARLAALRRTEIQLAVADNTCHQAWQATFDAVRHDLEAAFVAANATELKSYRSALAAASQQQ
jgi:hypothetical protein